MGEEGIGEGGKGKRGMGRGEGGRRAGERGEWMGRRKGLRMGSFHHLRLARCPRISSSLLFPWMHSPLSTVYFPESPSETIRPYLVAVVTLVFSYTP